MRSTARGSMVLDAIDVAMDPVKLLVAALGTLATLIVTFLILTVANIIDSSTPGFSPTAWLLRLIALILFWALAALFIGTVTRMSYADLTAETSPRWGESLHFSRSHWLANALAPVLLLVGVAILAIVEIILFAIARIPLLGDLLFGVLFAPLVLLNVLLGVMVAFGIILLFPAIAVDGFDAATAVPKVISLVRHHPGSIVATMLLSAAIAVAATLLLAITLTGATVLTAQFSIAGSGTSKAGEILTPELGALASGPGGIIGGFFGAFIVHSTTPTVILARLLVSLGMLVLFAAIYAFPATFLLTSACAVYLRHEPRPGDQDASEPERPAVAPNRAAVVTQTGLGATERSREYEEPASGHPAPTVVEGAPPTGNEPREERPPDEERREPSAAPPSSWRAPEPPRL